MKRRSNGSLLHLLDCDEMQGYLFSKPVPGEIFEARFLTPPSGGRRMIPAEISSVVVVRKLLQGT